jgi:hypothetical protein
MKAISSNLMVSRLDIHRGLHGAQIDACRRRGSLTALDGGRAVDGGAQSTQRVAELSPSASCTSARLAQAGKLCCIQLNCGCVSMASRTAFRLHQIRVPPPQAAGWRCNKLVGLATSHKLLGRPCTPPHQACALTKSVSPPPFEPLPDRLHYARDGRGCGEAQVSLQSGQVAGGMATLCTDRFCSQKQLQQPHA